MSLISEALRRARQEALEAREPERNARSAAAVGRSRGGRRSRAVPVLAVALCAAGLGAGGAWLSLHGGSAATVAEGGVDGPVAPAATHTATPTATPVATPGKPTEAAVAAPPTATPTQAVAHEQPAAAATARPPVSPTPTPTEAPLGTVSDVSGEGRVMLHRPRRVRPTPAVHREPHPTKVVPRQPHPTPVAEQRPKPTAPPREFDLTARVGGITLELDYLIYRPEDPFAQINGQEVHVGSVIKGFVVKEITRDYVRLHDAKGDLLLRVH